MKRELTLRWVKEIFGKFSFSKRLLAYGTNMIATMTDKVKEELRDYKIDSILIPGGCASYNIQAPEMSHETSRS